LASSLVVSGINAAYGAVRVIHDVSFRVGGGETVALLGTNGNGKSTLMKCIMGILRPMAGRIIADIDGVLRGKYIHRDKFLSAVKRGRERLHERSQETVTAGLGSDGSPEDLGY